MQGKVRQDPRWYIHQARWAGGLAILSLVGFTVALVWFVEDKDGWPATYWQGRAIRISGLAALSLGCLWLALWSRAKALAPRP